MYHRSRATSWGGDRPPAAPSSVIASSGSADAPPKLDHIGGARGGVEHAGEERDELPSRGPCARTSSSSSAASSGSAPTRIDLFLDPDRERPASGAGWDCRPAGPRPRRRRAHCGRLPACGGWTRRRPSRHPTWRAGSGPAARSSGRSAPTSAATFTPIAAPLLGREVDRFFTARRRGSAGGGRSTAVALVGRGRRGGGAGHRAAWRRPIQLARFHFTRMAVTGSRAPVRQPTVAVR
jgi:hypothetical protein